MTNPDQESTLNPRTALQGMIVEHSDPEALHQAVELALDYRGDITITQISTSQKIAGYVFDRRLGESPADSVLRIMTAEDRRLTVPYDDIAQIEFTGRDTAEGKSFETWMKKFVQKKLAGEEASIQSESTDGEAT